MKEQAPTGLIREHQLIKLLLAYLATGLFFMILPGTFLGVWNLFSISDAQSATTVSTPWIQAHGHAQLFGWIGSFILGIGFYSIPNVRRVSSWSYWEGWLCLAMWATGIALRWLAQVYLWEWKILLVLSAILELSAVLLFVVRTAQGHRMQSQRVSTMEPWSILVIAGTVGLFAAVCFNAVQCMSLFLFGDSPAFPADANAVFLILSVWAFPVPVAWGFTAHWMPVFLGLRETRTKMLLLGLTLNFAGVIAAVAHQWLASSLLFAMASISVVYALRIFEPPERPAKTQGVHRSFPVFMRAAYVWLIVASMIGIWAAVEPDSAGIGGAGRHAITIGFLMTMVFMVAPRILPAFLGRKKIFSETLMFLAVILTTTGCVLRVTSEILAYQQHVTWAWAVLPVSATLELIGVTIFTLNLIGTFLQPPLMQIQRCAQPKPG